jgi:hypothetical protein
MRAVAMKPTPLRDPAAIEITRLDSHPGYIAKREELAAIERRIAESEHRAKVGNARARGQRPTKTIQEQAQALIAGGRVSLAPAAEEIGAAGEELYILHTARFEKVAELEALAGELSNEVCTQHAPLAENSLRAALAAAEQLFNALEAGRILRGKIIGAGYALNSTSLPIHMFPVASMIGDSRVGAGTPAAQLREWLIARGIIDA